MTVGPNMNTARDGAAAACIGEDVYVVGGGNPNYHHLRTCERLRSGEWTLIASMNEKRFGLAMVAVDGKLFAFGGRRGGLANRRQLSSVECYDPERDQWMLVEKMPSARSNLAAAELNGSIYVCGGFNEGRPSVCERFDHRTDRWESLASMNEERYSFSLVAANGRLYAVGGHGDLTKSVEMYDANRNEWTVLPNELTNRRHMSSTVAL